MKIIAAPGHSAPNDNPYIGLLYGPMRRAGVTVDEWSRRRVVLGRYDVIHVHWPEFLVRAAPRRTTALDVLKVLVALWWARKNGAVLIWTGHDLEPHDDRGSRLLRIYFGLFVRQVDGLLMLDKSGLDGLTQRWPRLTSIPRAVVPHGHYRSSNPRPIMAREEVRRGLDLPVQGTIFLAFGQVRRYKNLPALVHSFSTHREDSETLLVAGRCSDSALAQELSLAAGPGVVLWLDGIDQDAVAAVFAASDVAVQCYRERSALNSGVLLLALSCQLPIVTSASPTNSAISDAVGPGWITQVDNEVDTTVFAARESASRGRPASPPNLAHLEWPALAERTQEFYRVVSAGRNPRTNTVAGRLGRSPKNFS